MAGNFGNYEDRIPYPRGNGYADGRIAIHEVVEEAIRHNAPGGINHGPGNITPGGNIYHSHDCSCRDGTWTYSVGNREPEPGALRNLIRRDHREIDQVNRTISARSLWSEIHPKMKHDGGYPKEFNLPKTVDDFRAMDISALDRILAAYDLTDTSITSITSSTSSDQRKNRQEIRNRKMWRLLEFLGADHLTPKHGEVEPHHSKHERYSGW